MKGQAKAAKRGEPRRRRGHRRVYVHATGKIGVLVEVNCETDFVARNDDFKEFAREVAQHIAAPGPEYVSRGRGPGGVHEGEKRVFEQQAAATSPRTSAAKIVEGKLSKWLEEVVLLNQEHVNQRQARGPDDRAAARGDRREDRARTWSSGASPASRSAQ